MSRAIRVRFAYALFQTHIELRRSVARYLQLMDPPQEHDKKAATHASRKPVRLIPRRRDHEIKRLAVFVPHAAVVAGKNAKLVVLRRQVGVLHVTDVDQLSPVLVLAFKLDAEAHLFRHGQAQCRVVDIEVAEACRQVHAI